MTRTVKRTLRALAVAMTLAAGVVPMMAAAPARAEDPSYLTFAGGMWNVSGTDSAAIASLEFTDGRRWLWFLHPMTGAFVNSDGGLYGYAGVAADIPLGSHLVLAPSFAPGLYMHNGSIDLGSVIEFRSSLKIAWQFDDKSRFGLDVNHLSNAGISHRNPGSNQVMVFYAIPYTH